MIAAGPDEMKITTLETYMLSAPLPQPVRTSTSTISRVSELIVRLTTDAGLVGIGEAHGPFLSQAGPEGMRAVGQILERVTPLLVGQDPFGVERIWQDLFALTYTSVRGIPTLAQQRRPLITAMSAIDIALWDLMGKATGRPVHALLGGALREPHRIFWLEDPMPWYDERHALRRLKAEVDVPIAAGETEYTPFGLRTMVAEGLVDYLIIDSTWAGGLTTWKKAALMTELYQVPLAAHHDPQIHVHAVAASPTGFILESFADPTRDPLWFELFRERPKIVDGFMAVPDAPGLGLELRPDTLEKYGVKLG